METKYIDYLDGIINNYNFDQEFDKIMTDGVYLRGKLINLIEALLFKKALEGDHENVCILSKFLCDVKDVADPPSALALCYIMVVIYKIINKSKTPNNFYI